MPYIREEERPQYDGLIKTIANMINRTSVGSMAGALNYVITNLLLATNPNDYHDYNELVGVLECAKLEFYRRRTVIYEDEKIKENGDVY